MMETLVHMNPSSVWLAAIEPYMQQPALKADCKSTFKETQFLCQQQSPVPVWN